ncbi:host cell division inhibitor Icd-like protein [Haemophilus haemolyticus]|uniref:host cell division inhibitor Icd-like protein n=1 Tax=Haemophilus haemolyticus TaxID=726 RepID=UPI00211D018C|nr:host cell division inhibitor Icd-like protein [Haemophilus haemolyticus]
MSDTQTKHFNKRAYYSAFSRLSPSIYAPLRKYLHENAKNNLLSAVKIGTLSPRSQKTTAEPGNSNKLSTAQNTPEACFFMRKLHTPKERPERLSMVACNGKGSALCCVPLIAVFQPVTRYRQNLENLAVTLEKFINGVTQMYQFIFALMRTPKQSLKIRILADNEQQARARFDCGDSLLFVGRINQSPRKNNRTLSTQGGVYA